MDEEEKIIAKSQIITKKDYKEFKALYKYAVEFDKSTFYFNDNLIATTYAKYVIEFLTDKPHLLKDETSD